jgi:aryl-alcohol dehydrogenase-like predicted oxidoreductase
MIPDSIGGKVLRYRALGGTGLTVSSICLGVLTMGPLQENMPVDEGAELIKYAFKRGINFFDTAESYRTYPYLRQALKAFKCSRTRPIITSKSYAYTWQGMKESVERARDEMCLAVIDIFLLHEQEDASTLNGHRAALEYLRSAKKSGMIKAVGISTHTVAGVIAGSENPDVEVIHPLINQGGIGIIGGSPQTMAAAISFAGLRGRGIYAMKALGGGNLMARAYQAFRFVSDHPAISSVAMGMKSREEIDVNIAWSAGERLPEMELKVRNLRRALLVEDWCQGCQACVEACRYQALHIEEEKAVVDRSKCILCGYCAGHCPNFCIKII